MDLRLGPSTVISGKTIRIPGSKSETNRLLLLQALFPGLKLRNASASEDSLVMAEALQSRSDVIDIGHAGTAMRFLAAYFAIQENRTLTLTGSGRMQQRPIGILVEALRQLGADINYVNQDGFPPLKIVGKKISKNRVTLNPDVSSQYVSALLLIAPRLDNGLELTLEGQITSRPYIEMTLSLLEEIGVRSSFERNTICVERQSREVSREIVIESDWSSASYFYSIVALSEIGTEIRLSSFTKNSVQGDSALVEIYKKFGVATEFRDGFIILLKSGDFPDESLTVEFQLNDTPDLAQTVAVTAFGLGIGCRLTGLHTLKIKETDRLHAMKTELEKLGATVFVTADSLTMQPAMLKPDVKIATYDDHRMAMAFAPLAVKVPIVIENGEVVSKSYPAFWADMESVGFKIDR